MIQLAIQTPPEHSSFAELRDVWQAADELGFRAAFTFDHFVPLNASAGPDRGPQLEGWTALAALAAGTRRMEVGTLVSGVTYRHPALLAKMAVTLDHITDGRAILGLGAAWHEEEHRMFGVPYPSVGDRMTLLDETLEAFHLLCGTDGPVDFEGRTVRLDQAWFSPKPIRPGGIPVLVGGSGPRLKRIAARHATMFNSFLAPWEWADVNDELDGLLTARGRPAEAMERTAFVFSELSGDTTAEDALVAHFQRTRGGSDAEVRARVLLGSDPDSMIAVLRSFEAAGVTLAIVNLRPPLRVEDLERFAHSVLPALG